jgi:ribosomal protein S18 acetylase RimI-like enzyme
MEDDLMNTDDMINPTNLTFRGATKEDLDFIAWSNYMSSSPAPGFCWWDPLIEGFGIETITFIRQAVALDVLAWCRIKDFVIAEHRSMPVAGATRFVMREDDYRPLNLSQIGALYKALEWSDSHIRQFEAKYEAVWSNPQDETLRPSGTWTIECVAVVERARRRGVGAALMRHIIDEARAEGVESIGISVTIGNQAAEALYQSVGFQPYITYFGEYYDGMFPGTAKFRIRLSPERTRV